MGVGVGKWAKLEKGARGHTPWRLCGGEEAMRALYRVRCGAKRRRKIEEGVYVDAKR